MSDAPTPMCDHESQVVDGHWRCLRCGQHLCPDDCPEMPAPGAASNEPAPDLEPAGEDPTGVGSAPEQWQAYADDMAAPRHPALVEHERESPDHRVTQADFCHTCGYRPGAAPDRPNVYSALSPAPNHRLTSQDHSTAADAVLASLPASPTQRNRDEKDDLDVEIPRWDQDKTALSQGWVTPDRCGKCGEPNPEVARLRADVGALEKIVDKDASDARLAVDRLRAAVADRDARLAAVEALASVEDVTAPNAITDDAGLFWRGGYLAAFAKVRAALGSRLPATAGEGT